VKQFRSFAIGAFAAMVLAMGIGAGTAGAAAFYVDNPYSGGAKTVEGTQIAKGEFSFSGGPVGCSGQNFHNAPLEEPGTTLTPTYMDDGYCGAYVSKELNGCRPIFHADHTMDIGPAGCGPIVFKTPYSCEFTIPAQTGLGEVAYHNVEGSPSVDIVQRVSGMEYTQKGKCTAGTFTNGKWYAEWNAAGFVSGIPTGFHFGPVPTGIFVSPEYKLDAEGFPVSLSGSQPSGAPHKFGTAYGTVQCETAQFSGEPSAASTEVSLQPSYSGSCTSNGLTGTTVAMNGCTYVAHIAASGPPYTGTADIACPAGKSMEIVMKVLGTTKCTWAIGAQSGLSGLTFTNSGSGVNRQVTVGYNLSGIAYHQQEGSGLGKCTTGNYENGTYQGDLPLTGTRFP
jgi:hypothetical protein